MRARASPIVFEALSETDARAALFMQYPKPDPESSYALSRPDPQSPRNPQFCFNHCLERLALRHLKLLVYSVAFYE